jgi:hypothetical protein
VKPAPLALLALLAGCVEPAERATPWPYLHAAVIEPGCATGGCHTPTAAEAGLDLSTPVRAHGLLVGGVCGEAPTPGEPAGNFVIPFEPERSRLMHLLRGDDANLRMPPDAALPDGEIALIEQWILEGARCD